MRMILPTVAIVATSVFLSCTAQRPPADGQQPPAAAAQRAETIAAGTVTQLSDGHGNVYTSIAPDQYEALGLEPGMWIRVIVADAAIEMPVGRDYADVPSGEPLAVLHREGLTFAIRDGNFSATHGVAVGDAFRIVAASPKR